MSDKVRFVFTSSLDVFDPLLELFVGIQIMGKASASRQIKSCRSLATVIRERNVSAREL